MTATTQFYGTGRRKTATARVYLRPGSGRILINDRELEDYFPRASLRMDLQRPLKMTEVEGQYDVIVNLQGGGMAAQAGALRLGLSRALLELNPAFRATLKPVGFLTRDAREVERKKYGRAGARRRFQFSKR
jgi:small subunit ribosomal protein S9